MDRNRQQIDVDAGIVVRTLARFRSRIRRVLLVERSLVIAAAVVAAVFVAVALDFIFRAPSTVRLVGLVGAVGVFVSICWRWLVPVLRFNPDLADLALRVPSDDREHEAVAAAVRYAGHDNAPARFASQIEREVAHAAARDVRSRPFGRFVRLDRVARASAVFAIAACAVGVAGVVRPAMTTIGAQRILTPWADVRWPQRTLIDDVTGTAIQPTTRALVLRANMQRTNRVAGQTRVVAKYRVFKGRKPLGDVRQIVLAAQPDVGAYRDLYEQVIGRETWAGRTPGDASAWSIRYWFESIDDRTDPVTVRLADPPSVVLATSEVVPPAYFPTDVSDQLGKDVSHFVVGTQPVVFTDQGRGTVADTIRVLEHSSLRILLDMNKPLAHVQWVNEQGVSERATDDNAASMPAITITHDEARVIIESTMTSSIPISLRFEDRDGLVSERDTTVLVETITDELPSPTLLDPAQDEWVLPTARFDVAGEVVDDVALSRASIAWQLARGVRGSAGAPPEPAGERVEIATREAEAGAVVVDVTLTSPLAIAQTDAHPGDEIHLVALGSDKRMASMTPPMEPIASRVRRLRVVSEEQFVDRMWQSLDMVRDAAKAADAQQSAMIENTNTGVRSTTQQDQQAITDRVNAQMQAVRDAMQNAQRNGLDRPDIDRVLSDAAGATQRASESSQQAAQAWDDNSDPGVDSDTGPSEKAAEHQQEVRDALGDLLRALDRGSDAFLARRAVARMLENQEQLNQRTADLAQRTLGKREDQLRPDERAEMAELTRAQQELSQRAADMMDELADQQQKLEQSDPVGAEIVDNAERIGRDQSLSQRMQQASNSLQQNQNQQAQRDQQEATETLEQMMEEFEQAEQTRDRVLERLFADMKQQIQVLVTMQETELGTLDTRVSQSPDAPVFDGLDKGMISLHKATGPVIELANSAMPESASIVDSLGHAETAMLDAIEMLRASNAPGTRDAETISLEKLLLAMEDAERLRSESANRDRDRQQKELRKAYAEIRELQQRVHDDTAEYVGKELSRKERVLVRRLAATQREVGQKLRELPEKYEGLFEASTLAFAHRRMDTLVGSAAGALDDGNATVRVERDQTSVLKVLDQLTEAMDSASQNTQEFAEGQSSQQGGNQQGQNSENQPLFEALAELELLRAMQLDLHDQTRFADEVNAEKGEVEGLGLLQREIAQETSALLKRLTRQGPGQGAPGDEPPAAPPGMGFDALRYVQPDVPAPQLGTPAAQPEKPASNDMPADPQKEPESSDPELRSLDDLLGLDGEPTSGLEDNAELLDLLEGERDSNPLASAARLMSRAAERLTQKMDAGVTTQRIQEQILLDLEKVIKEAREQQQQQQQQSQSQSQQQSNPDQQQPSQQNQNTNENPQGDNTGQQATVAGQQAQPGAMVGAAQAKWGNLPARVRDTLTQGSSDSFSSMYRSLTEAYYKRLAEEGNR